MKKIFVIIFLALSSSFIWANNSDQLVESIIKTYIDSIGNNYLGIYYKNHPDWHTYWKNPGHAGIPLTHKFYDLSDKELKFKELEWPKPQKILSKDLVSYGYQGGKIYGFYFEMSPTMLDNLEAKKIKIQANWLACRKSCIPGSKTTFGSFENRIFKELTAQRPPPFTIPSSKEDDIFNSIPKKAPWPSKLKVKIKEGGKDEKNQLILLASIEGLIPFPHPILTFHNEIAGKTNIDWDGIYLDDPIPLPKDGLFSPPLNLKFIFNDLVIQKTFYSFKDEGIKGQSGELNILLYILLAFLGGLILNIMPCVLPVISLKLFGLIKQRDTSSRSILKHNFFYTLGVLCSFLILALVVILFKKGGEEIGWGFHLQSPYFVSIIIILLFILSLNLFGTFEFRTPGGKFLGKVNLKGPYEDFFAGVLATILSTPCSAPFLGSALALAFTSNWPTIILIFLFIGLGLSFPFILTGIFPKMLLILPRPGQWMENVKKYLGLTLLLTCIWLIDVLLSLTSSPLTILYLNLTLALIFFTIFTLKHRKTVTLFLIFSLIMTFKLFSTLNFKDKNIDNNNKEHHSLLKWEKWTEDFEEKYKKHFVFVDFTADWCLTCKVNEKMVLETTDFLDLVKQKNIVLLKGDWTRRDPIISRWLRSFGVAGVPAYFIKDPQGKITYLGELITIDKIKKHL